MTRDRHASPLPSVRRTVRAPLERAPHPRELTPEREPQLPLRHEDPLSLGQLVHPRIEQRELDQLLRLGRLPLPQTLEQVASRDAALTVAHDRFVHAGRREHRAEFGCARIGHGDASFLHSSLWGSRALPRLREAGRSRPSWRPRGRGRAGHPVAGAGAQEQHERQPGRTTRREHPHRKRIARKYFNPWQVGQVTFAMRPT